ncbi:DEAD-box ATP-dependent RNA helicase 38-like [Cornus florida]|uniref:DEAD-box ATP-dependent RNA helicase 38-like n=1 Tax=Cornus florida TaxID=4283 RepID=UPI0028A0C4BA|nr:DEAD-box ATP-dependent RNA helicase 38-like [Cornus florida]
MAGEELSLEYVKQYKVKCPDELSKIKVIRDRIFYLGNKVGETIIFVHSRNSASMLHQALVEHGYGVTTIQGALDQDDRNKIIKEFKNGLIQVLISTELLSRGFDQAEVSLVVNYDLPVKYQTPSEPDYEVYLHRIGRAGRFGPNVLSKELQLYFCVPACNPELGEYLLDLTSWSNESASSHLSKPHRVTPTL